MISSHVHQWLGWQLFSEMCRLSLRPNESGLLSALRTCSISSNFQMGKLLHGFMTKTGFVLSVFCSTSLLDLYAKCGHLPDAHKYFECIQLKSVATWNTIIDGYVKGSYFVDAVELFCNMILSGVRPSCITYSILTKMCVDLSSHGLGMAFHGHTVKTGFENHKFIGSALVELYAKCGSMDDGCKVFRRLKDKDNVVFSVLLSGYHQSGEIEQAVDVFLEFVSEGYKLDSVMFANIFSLCSEMLSPLIGIQIYCQYIKSGFISGSFIGAITVVMYSTFGMILDAYKSFLEIREKNDICFNAMVMGLTSNSYYIDAINIFSQMRKMGCVAGCTTLTYVLRAYVNLHVLKECKAVHSHIVKTVDESNLYTRNAVIESYAKSGESDEALEVLKGMDICNEYSWTAIISAYIELQKYGEALKLFHEIHSMTIIKPSAYTLVPLIQACSGLQLLEQGQQIHAYIVKLGFGSHAFTESSLICMYAQCSQMKDACRVFSVMCIRDIVSWSCMIKACTYNSHSNEALRLFRRYWSVCSVADESIFSCCLSACASLTALENGQWVHMIIVKTGYEAHLHVRCAIVDMYCKCGTIQDAISIFNDLEDVNAISWTAMLCGCAQHGLGEEALGLFDAMKKCMLEPDEVTFLGALSACNHAGLVKEGWQYFMAMQSQYGLKRKICHYATMVDLLGRAGFLKDAGRLITEAPFQSKAPLLRTLLGACKKHGNIKVGEQMAGILQKLEPNEPSSYVLLSDIYALASMWDLSTGIQKKIKADKIRVPGCSWTGDTVNLPGSLYF